MRLRELLGNLNEEATSGSTSAGNIADVVNPHIAAGSSSALKKWSGSPGKMGKSIKPPMPKQQKPRDNALDMNVNLMGGTAIKR